MDATFAGLFQRYSVVTVPYLVGQQSLISSASSLLSRRTAVPYLVGQQSLISSDSSPLSRRTAVPYLVGQQSLISSDSSSLYLLLSLPLFLPIVSFLSIGIFSLAIDLLKASQKHGNFNTRKKVENKEDKITFETPLQ
ncbi:hypothetical protein POVCU2_0044310 [Plasmodium ovale curtisi]|uniref:Uncharacterized protein n=1 Tax=Plasmodium ovale curtisi TaxID=864141 RepID=A0A1A8W6Z2_PLAOA|nr:hypothetical protein POVCU2_0044310 [Plasmodium ovale curtisi]